MNNTMMKNRILVLGALSVTSVATAALVSPRFAQQQAVGSLIPTVNVTVASTDILFHSEQEHDFAALGGVWKIRCSLGLAYRGETTSSLTAHWFSIREATNGMSETDAGMSTEYSVGFPVTSLAFQEDGTALVAGVSSQNGSRLIEKWTFVPPIRQSDGTGGFTVSGGRVASKVLVFNSSSAPDFPYISGMVTGGGMSSTEALLLTSPESSIYRFNETTGLASLVLDESQPVGSLLPEPLLREPFKHFFYWGRHVDFGHCFVLTTFDGLGAGEGELESLMLTDVDLDGGLDGVHYIVNDPTDPLGLSVASNWID